jgi:hypothetical protein
MLEPNSTNVKGLVSNGAKVYLVALPSDPITEVVNELNGLGRESGGSAEGYERDKSGNTKKEYSLTYCSQLCV